MIRVVVAAAVLLSAPRMSSADVHRFAIVVGNNVSDSRDVPTLRYADDDAVATHLLLEEAGATSVLLARLDADTARLHPGLVPDGAPTLVALEAAVGRLARAMRTSRGRTELLVYYSGHGDVAAGEGYLVLEDGHLTRTRLYEGVLASSPAAQNHVIVDACKSYFVAFEKGPGGTRERLAGSLAPRTRLTNTGFLLSTSSDRDSHEWELYQAGVFSHELRSGLRGGADANADGRVTYAELGAFLRTANEAIANERYRPDFTVRPPTTLTDVVLAWSTPPSLRVDAALGHVYIETASGTRLLDAHPAPGLELALHLPAARPVFLRTASDEEEYVVDGRTARVSELTRRAVSVARRGALQLAFRALFSVPFDRDRVAAFRAGDGAKLQVPMVIDEREPRGRSGTRAAIGWIAIGSATTGLAMSMLAVERHRAGQDASHAELVEINRTITRANNLSVALYAVAAAAGVTWWLMSPGGDQRVRVEPSRASGLTVSFESFW